MKNIKFCVENISNEETYARVKMIGVGRPQLLFPYEPSEYQILMAPSPSPSQHQCSISHGAFQPQAVPASQCLGDVTYAGIGCLFGSTPQNDSVPTVRPFWLRPQRICFQSPNSQKTKRPLSVRVTQVIVLQSTDESMQPFRSIYYILYHSAVKT